VLRVAEDGGHVALPVEQGAHGTEPLCAVGVDEEARGLKEDHRRLGRGQRLAEDGRLTAFDIDDEHMRCAAHARLVVQPSDKRSVAPGHQKSSVALAPLSIATLMGSTSGYGR